MRTVRLILALTLLSALRLAAQGVLSPSLLRQSGATDGQVLCWSNANSRWQPCTDQTGGTPAFSSITGGTNTGAAMIVGTGASLTTSGSGTITATSAATATTASTATALAANGSNCSAGQAAAGVDASGAAEGCAALSADDLSDNTLSDLSDVTAKSGNTTVVATTSGTLTSGDCVEFDASGNLVAAGAACGSGSGSSINVEENNVEVVAAAALTGIDFLGADFDVTNSTNEADVAIAAAITRDAEWDTIAEIETATSVNIIVSTEVDTIAELDTLVADATLANLVYSTSTFGTDNVIVRADSTARNVQASAATIDDSGNISTTGSITAGTGGGGTGSITGAAGSTTITGGTGAGDDLIFATTSNVTKGSYRFSELDCTGNANGGALTADASGNITCTDDDGGSSIAFSGITGATNTSAAMVVGTGASLSASGSGTIAATTAAALAANGANCSAGQVAGGVDASGAAESCLDPIVSTEIDASSEIAAIVADETGSGALVFGTSPTLTTPVIDLPATDPTTNEGRIAWNSTTNVLMIGETGGTDYVAQGNSSGEATSVANDTVALTTDTTGNYVASVATTAPITGGAAGSEGATLTIALNQNAGTDVTADLEEETHASEHAENAADELLIENLGTACTSGQVAASDGAGGLDCTTVSSGGTDGSPNYTESFTTATSVSMTNAEHGFGHANLIVECYDNASPKAKIEPASVTVNTSTYEVIASFSPAASGSCTVNGSGNAATWYAPVAFASIPACSTTAFFQPLTNSLYDYAYCDGASTLTYFFGGKQVTPPVDGDFSWINQDTASVSTTNGGVVLSSTPNAGVEIFVRYQAAPTPPYHIQGCFTYATGTAGHAGLVFGEAATGEWSSFGFEGNSNISVNNWTTATSFSAAGRLLAGTQHPTGKLVCLRIGDDGTTNRTYEFSSDGGISWVDFYTVGRTTFLTADRVGFFVYSGSATYGDVSMNLIHWLEE